MLMQPIFPITVCRCSLTTADKARFQAKPWTALLDDRCLPELSGVACPLKQIKVDWLCRGSRDAPWSA